MPNDMFKNNWEEAGERERDGKTAYHERIRTGERPLRQPPVDEAARLPRTY